LAAQVGSGRDRKRETRQSTLNSTNTSQGQGEIKAETGFICAKEEQTVNLGQPPDGVVRVHAQ